MEHRKTTKHFTTFEGQLLAGSHGQRFSDRGLFSCPKVQRHVVNLDGTRRYRCPVQSKFAVTRLPPVFGRFTSPLRTGFTDSSTLCLRQQGKNPRSKLH